MTFAVCLQNAALGHGSGTGRASLNDPVLKAHATQQHVQRSSNSHTLSLSLQPHLLEAAVRHLSLGKRPLQPLDAVIEVGARSAQQLELGLCGCMRRHEQRCGSVL